MEFDTIIGVLISFDGNVSSLFEIVGVGVTAVVTACAARRWFCLSRTDNRGFDLHFKK